MGLRSIVIAFALQLAGFMFLFLLHGLLTSSLRLQLFDDSPNDEDKTKIARCGLVVQLSKPKRLGLRVEAAVTADAGRERRRLLLVVRRKR